MDSIMTIRRRGFGAAILAVLLGACAGLGSQPTSSPAPTPTPQATSHPTPSSSPAPPLAESFTSTLHGFSMSYPEGWTAQPATEPWMGAPVNFGDPPADNLYDPTLTDHLFLSVASQPIGDSPPEEWVAEHLFECTGSEAAAVDGAAGLIGAGDCNVVAVTTDGRGYMFALYTSGDEAWLGPTFDRAWFEEVLATAQLHPEDAVDTLPSPSP
jgi:hypothetical protein